METFSLDGIRGKCLKGRAFAIENPRMDVVFLTGMDEHSLRYEDFARFLNENGISLYVLDAPGQGLNADSPDRLQVWKEGDFDDTVRFANKMVEKIRARWNHGPLDGVVHGSALSRAVSFDGILRGDDWLKRAVSHENETGLCHFFAHRE